MFSQNQYAHVTRQGTKHDQCVRSPITPRVTTPAGVAIIMPNHRLVLPISERYIPSVGDAEQPEASYTIYDYTIWTLPPPVLPLRLLFGRFIYVVACRKRAIHFYCVGFLHCCVIFH